MARILVVDNYDSFVYNLVQYLGELGAELLVRRNDEVAPGSPELECADGVLISPGPGRPEEAGAAVALVAALAGRVPVLGVCLGHQCIAAAFGAQIARTAVVHGKTSTVTHDGRGVFAGLANPLTATRYHSLAVVAGSLPAELEATAWAEDGTLMGLRHREHRVEGVQFHPESVLTEAGHELLGNWLGSCGLDSPGS